MKRTGRPKGILETRSRPRLKRHERSGQSDPQEHVPLGFLVAHSRKLRCLHRVGRCWEKARKASGSGPFTETSSPRKQNTTTAAKHCWT